MAIREQASILVTLLQAVVIFAPMALVIIVFWRFFGDSLQRWVVLSTAKGLQDRARRLTQDERIAVADHQHLRSLAAENLDVLSLDELKFWRNAARAPVDRVQVYLNSLDPPPEDRAW